MPGRRVPLFATVVVAGAAAVMIALGLWQLERKAEKEAMIALFLANSRVPAEIAFPASGPLPPAALFRRSRVECVPPIALSPRAGRDAAGRSTYRIIADCAAPAGAPVLVALGTSDSLTTVPQWDGGVVRGIVVPGPDQPSLMDRLLGRAVPARPLLVADPPVPGWAANAAPAPDDVPNNHLAYAVQWFVFAISAVLIYGLALRRRWTAPVAGRPE